jgi:hypothetical protein
MSPNEYFTHLFDRFRIGFTPLIEHSLSRNVLFLLSVAQLLSLFAEASLLEDAFIKLCQYVSHSTAKKYNIIHLGIILSSSFCST